MTDVKQLIIDQLSTRPIRISLLDTKGYPKLLIDQAIFDLSNENKIEINIYDETLKLAK